MEIDDFIMREIVYRDSFEFLLYFNFLKFKDRDNIVKIYEDFKNKNINFKMFVRFFARCCVRIF